MGFDLAETMKAILVEQMVQRFLSWPLPKSFAPDGGVTFSRKYFGPGGQEKDREPGDPFWPIGTNLFTADEAREMILHMLAEEDHGQTDRSKA